MVIHCYAIKLIDLCPCYLIQGVCTEAGMFALRERRVHVTQEDFEMAVSKVTDNCTTPWVVTYSSSCLHQVMQKDAEKNMSVKKLWK